MVYVPNSGSNTVDVIDPRTFRVVNHFKVGRQPQHVTPSYDLKTLWVLSDLGDSLTRIDPATGEKRETVPVKDPYNMYYTPDGKYAIVVAERVHRLDFRNPTTMALVDSVPVPCRGVDHMDFSANGRYLIASCEFSGTLIKVDVAKRAVIGTLDLTTRNSGGETAVPTAMVHPFAGSSRRKVYTRNHPASGSMPQDVKTSPDGKIFYVADMVQDGVHLIDGETFTRIGFIPTGRGAHGLYPSRDSKLLYCSNRDEGTISVISFEDRKVVRKWTIPGGTPDMGGVSAGRQGVLAIWPVQERSLCDRHQRRTPDSADSRRQGTARPVHLSPTRPLLARPHRRLSVATKPLLAVFRSVSEPFSSLLESNARINRGAERIGE